MNRTSLMEWVGTFGQNLPRRANHYLGIRSRDWPLLLLMLLHVFLALTVMISLRSVNSGPFLSAYPVSVYPWYFLAESMLSFILSIAYNQLVSGRLEREWENLGFIAFFALVLLLGRILLWRQLPWINFALPVCSDALVAILLIQCWGLFANCIDSRKARRLFPLIGLGGTCGGICGGWAASQLAGWLGTPNLLFFEILLLGGLGLGAWMLIQKSPDLYSDQRLAQEMEAALQKKQSLSQRLLSTVQPVFSSRLLLLVLLIMLCVRVGSTIMDYQMQLQLKAAFNQNEITAYMGSYLAIASFATLVVQLFVENRVINAHGVTWGMGSTPLTLLVGISGFFLSPGLLWITMAKFLEQLTKNSLFKTAVELSYIPFAPGDRQRLKVLNNGILSLTTVPLASLTIMIFAAQTQVLLGIALAFALLGLGLSVLLQAPYTGKLHEALMRRQLLTEHDDLDAVSQESLERYLTRGDNDLIYFALDLLKRQTVQIQPEKLLPLVFHESPNLREGALRLLTHSGTATEVQLVVDTLVRENQPRVQQACLEVLREIGDETLNPVVLPFLEHPVLKLRTESLIFLFTCGGIEGILAGAESLKAMMRSEDRAILAGVAYALGEIGIRYFRQDFLQLLHHEDELVVQAALWAAERSLPKELAGSLLPLLGDVRYARQARQALQKLDLQDWLPDYLQISRQEKRNLNLQVELIRLLGAYSEPDAIVILMQRLQEPDIRIKSQVLQSLQALRKHENVNLQAYRQQILAQLHREFYYGYSYYYLLSLMRKQPLDKNRVVFMQREMLYRIEFVQKMIFKLLSLLYPPAQIEKAWLNFHSQSAFYRSLSLEVLSYTLEQEILNLVLTFLDDLSYTQKTALASEHQIIDETIAEAWWQSEVIREDPWLRQISLWLRQSEHTQREERKMFQILDRMFLLKQTPLFGSFHAEQLYPVASAAREMYVPAQTVIFNQGQPGDAFYIISSGEVQVERKGHRVTVLREKEGFGELEILTAAPRIATVRTLGECELLVITREDFIDLVEEYSSFSRSLLEVLSERLSSHVLRLGATGPLSREDLPV